MTRERGDVPTAPAAPTEEERAAATEQTGRSSLPLPFAGARVPLPHVRVPHVPRPHVGLPSQRTVMVGALRATDTVRDNMPPRDQLVYYGGLGALAAFGLVDWPVAAAIGAGVWLAGRRRGAGRGREPAGRMDTDQTTSAAKEPEHTAA